MSSLKFLNLQPAAGGIVLVFLLFLSTTAMAQITWKEPPEPIVSMLEAPQPQAVSISPDNHWLVSLDRPSLLPIAELAEPIVRVAGIQLNPRTHGPAQEYAYRGMTLKPLEAETAKPVALPKDARIRHLRWSWDGRYLAFTLTRSQGIELWVLDVEQGQSRRLSGAILNATYGNPCDWLPGEAGLICKVVPESLGQPPEKATIPQGPSVEENLGRKAPARTYTNLLQTLHDEALFEYYLTSCLDHIALDGTRTQLTQAALIDEAIPSPDGQWILVRTFHRPFSYQVPLSRFPKRIEVLDRTGAAVYQVADLPLADDIPVAFDSVRQGRRKVSWRADRPATLYWVEALDSGDSRKPVPFRDAIYLLEAPFEAKPQLLLRSQLRYEETIWGQDDVALMIESWYDTRQLRIWKLDPSNPETKPLLIEERNFQDAYNDSGSPVTATGPYGWSTVLLAPDGESVYLKGRGASPKGIYPFLDRLNLQTKEKVRLWQARDPYYEKVIRVLDAQAQQLVTQRQSNLEPPNYFLRQRGAQTTLALTDAEDPMPWYVGVTQRVVRYPRQDGVMLSATLYLPPGYEPERDGPLPALLWAYPREHKSRATASQVTVAANAFSRPSGSSVLFLLTQGYAVLMGPTMPIIGEGDVEPNDTYVEQLVASAQAAVDFLVAEGVAERDRIAIGGHSYGAFTVANLLAHSDLFRAGIARSGAYNRTLTPFGFQGEQRSFWEAQDTYIRMSPFTYAGEINEPLLLIHGANDSNTGTYPLQSERLYEAMKGLGGTVRWVVLPFEDHGYRSREAVEQVLWEMIQWLDRYVK